MLFLTTYIFDPLPEEIVFALAIFFVPAAILWGIARSKVLGDRTNLLVRSLAYGFGGTGLLLAFSIFVALGTLQGHYHLYGISKVDPLFWLVTALGGPLGFTVSVVFISVASFVFLTYRGSSKPKIGF
jgi:hypothetical protein